MNKLPEDTSIVHIKDVQVGFRSKMYPGASWWLQIVGGFILALSSLSLALHVLGVPFLIRLLDFAGLSILLMIFGPTVGLALMLSPWVVHGSSAKPDKEGNRTFLRGAVVAVTGIMLLPLAMMLFLSGLRWG